MKCLKKGTEIIRVSDAKADQLVKTGDYNFCAKSEWKRVRDAGVVAVKTEKVEKEKAIKLERKNAVIPPKTKK